MLLLLPLLLTLLLERRLLRLDDMVKLLGLISIARLFSSMHRCVHKKENETDRNERSCGKHVLLPCEAKVAKQTVTCGI